MLFLQALARPIPAEPEVLDSSSITATIPDACDDINRCRTVLSILWNCFSLVFVCTWIAIHPNVPQVGRHSVNVILDYVLIMFIALLAPELIILWAMRQWYSARRITEKYKEFRWGKSHAFLALMGGFVLYEGETFVCYLWDRDCFGDSCKEAEHGYVKIEDQGIFGTETRVAVRIEKGLTPESKDYKEAAQEIHLKYTCLLHYLLAKGHITVNEDEIRSNLNHGDALSKLIAVFQTSWFIIQCIARPLEHLALTQIEVITLAFAVLNFITYYLWWNKPLRVRYPVRIVMAGLQPSNDAPPRKHFLKVLFKVICSGLRSLRPARWYTLPLVPIHLLVLFFYKVLDIVVGTDSDDSAKLFSSRLRKDPPQLYIAVYLIAFVFGAIHCIPWFFTFPTPVEQTLWRISALLVTFLPIATAFFHSINDRDFQFSYHPQYAVRHPFLGKVIDVVNRAVQWSLQTILHITLVVLISSFVVLHTAYIVARVIMLVSALMEFRRLTPSAYRTVQWATFIPHIGN
ncbi:hypothetical protein VNI00_013954 [Paramarasmius palmivorus]|uniref:Uncharacterized protein n=1 Tax=Paramarasmius palmivorus TaxID=297713 RepID=A0AAW0BXR4_9AGAR